LGMSLLYIETPYNPASYAKRGQNFVPRSL